MKKVVRLPEKTSGDIITYYAGAKFADDKALLSNGGRVYMLVTTKEDVKSAQDAIYAELATQDTTGSFLSKRYRKQSYWTLNQNVF